MDINSILNSLSGQQNNIVPAQNYWLDRLGPPPTHLPTEEETFEQWRSRKADEEYFKNEGGSRYDRFRNRRLQQYNDPGAHLESEFKRANGRYPRNATELRDWWITQGGVPADSTNPGEFNSYLQQQEYFDNPTDQNLERIFKSLPKRKIPPTSLNDSIMDILGRG